MAELGPNYNIQCMKLFQELKASFPSIPDSVVRHCMKQNRNDFQKCKEELTTESENYTVGRYGVRTKALLSHQMEQFLMLKTELNNGKREVDGMKTDIKSMQQELKAQEMMIQRSMPKILHVKKLETDIGTLRGSCDQMSKKVQQLTAGKVPLGETSINFDNYVAQNNLSQSHGSVPDLSPANVSVSSTNNSSSRVTSSRDNETQDSDWKWSCSECTFENHPSLEFCEICEMPNINLEMREVESL